jgi:copper/silver efflux system protein
LCDQIASVAVPMIGGMVSSTLLTLIVIPAIYAVVKGVAVAGIPVLAPRSGAMGQGGIR